jgi:hypothetical protein
VLAGVAIGKEAASARHLAENLVSMGFERAQALLQNPEQVLRLGRIMTAFAQLARQLGLTVNPHLGFRNVPIGSR